MERERAGNPLVSMIVPVYKSGLLKRCVDSLLAQTYRNMEIILVDDESPDGGGRICNEYGEKDTRVRVIHQKNGGISAARNTGLDACRGEVIYFPMMMILSIPTWWRTAWISWKRKRPMWSYSMPRNPLAG